MNESSRDERIFPWWTNLPVMNESSRDERIFPWWTNPPEMWMAMRRVIVTRLVMSETDCTSILQIPSFLDQWETTTKRVFRAFRIIRIFRVSRRGRVVFDKMASIKAVGWRKGNRRRSRNRRKKETRGGFSTSAVTSGLTEKNVETKPFVVDITSTYLVKADE